MSKDQEQIFKDVYSLETLIKTIIPSAVFWYDPQGQLVIYTNQMTDEDGTLIPFKVPNVYS